MITTVVFDLDDTLYDEIDYCKSGYRAVAGFVAELPDAPSAGCIYDALWGQFTYGNRKKIFDASLDKLGINYDEKLIEGMVNVYRSHIPNLVLPQDSLEVLCEFRAKYTLALITDGFLPAQKLKVQALGIEKFFKCIVYTEQLGREFWKPSAAGFEKIIEILNVKPENAAYIADNEKKDFIAPNKLGFFTVQLVRPARLHTKASSESNGRAQHVIYNISQLPALLDEH